MKCITVAKDDSIETIVKKYMGSKMRRGNNQKPLEWGFATNNQRGKVTFWNSIEKNNRSDRGVGRRPIHFIDKKNDTGGFSRDIEKKIDKEKINNNYSVDSDPFDKELSDEEIDSILKEFSDENMLEDF